MFVDGKGYVLMALSIITVVEAVPADPTVVPCALNNAKDKYLFVVDW